MPTIAVPPGMTLADAQQRLALPAYFTQRIEDDTSSATLRVNGMPTASGTAHTKGAWAQIVASTAEDCHIVDIVRFADTGNSVSTGVDRSTLLDIGVGGAGSEVVVASNIATGYHGAGPTGAGVGGNNTTLPLTIAKGSRVAVRIQSAVTSRNHSLFLIFSALPHGRRPKTSVVAMGDNTATSRGVTVTAPGSLSTKGAWVQITASTTEPFSALSVGIQGAGSATLGNDGSGLLDIGIGGAGSETVLIPDIQLYTYVGVVTQLGTAGGLYRVNVPLGSRLSARYSRAETTTVCDVILHGIRS